MSVMLFPFFSYVGYNSFASVGLSTRGPQWQPWPGSSASISNAQLDVSYPASTNKLNITLANNYCCVFHEDNLFGYYLCPLVNTLFFFLLAFVTHQLLEALEVQLAQSLDQLHKISTLQRGHKMVLTAKGQIW